MRKWYALLIIAFICVGTGLVKAQPNIVLIISDDHAYQAISAYGNSTIKTPNIDRLAQQGARFTKSYVNNSLCGPSRASILTATYSHKNGFRDNDHSTFNFNQNSFAKELQKAGYQTAWIGKMHLSNEAVEGFDYYSILPGQGQYYNPDFIESAGKRTRYNGYVTNIITDLANGWLDKRDHSKPFCLVIGHKATHRPWQPDLPDLGRYDSLTFKLPPNFYDDYSSRKAAAVQDMTISETMTLDYDLKVYPNQDSLGTSWDVKRMDAAQKEKYLAYYDKIQKQYLKKKPTGRALTEWKYQRYMKDYLATAASLDRNIGRTLDYLDKNGLADNTIVIYMSDQGFYMGEHGWFDKRFMYEESFRTPMVMRYPGVIKPQTVISNLIMSIDIGPTLLQAAGAAVPGQMQGYSFLPLLQQKPYTARKDMYYHYYENGIHAVSPHFGISTGRYKLIRFYEKVDSWELFDLEKDPQEMRNVYTDKRYQPVVAELKRKLLSLIKKYEDEEAEKIFNTPIRLAIK
jgi:arylsulfatase A-like enzyme